MRSGQNIRAARRLRQSANLPEMMAWQTLRTLRKQGVVDFAVTKSRLALEIEGGVHALPEVAARDAVRRREIESLGWRVVRIPPEIALSGDHLLTLMQRELGL